MDHEILNIKEMKESSSDLVSANEDSSNPVTSETGLEVRSTNEDSLNPVASETGLEVRSTNEDSSNPVAAESGFEVRSTERRFYTGKSLNLNEERIDLLDPVGFNTDNNAISSNLSTRDTLNEVRSAESRCSVGKDDDLEDMSENSLNRVASFSNDSLSNLVNKNSSYLVTCEILNEVKCAESRCFTGKDDGLEDIDVNSSNLIAINTRGNICSTNPVTPETLNEIRISESGCSTGKDDDLEYTGESSSNSMAINNLGKGILSSSVTLETPNVIRSAEGRYPTGKDGEIKHTGENSSSMVASTSVIEVRCTKMEFCASENRVSKTKTDFKENWKPEDQMKVIISDPVSCPCVVIDVKGDDGGLDNRNSDGEEVCRICHLNSDHLPDASDFIQLGCNCKDDLGIAHRYCAEAWFKLKGNR